MTLCWCAGCKVVDIKFHHSGSEGAGVQNIISTDTRSCKIWQQSSGKTYTVLEPAEGDINDVCVWPSSGLIVSVLAFIVFKYGYGGVFLFEESCMKYEGSIAIYVVALRIESLPD